MVNQEIVTYLKEGKKRGFSEDVLKKKLLDGGFDAKEVDDAIRLMGAAPGAAAKPVAAAKPAMGAAMPGRMEEKPKKKSKMWIWILVVVLIIILILIGLFLYL